MHPSFASTGPITCPVHNLPTEQVLSRLAGYNAYECAECKKLREAEESEA